MRNIYFIWWKTYHCRRILNQVHLRWWHFVVKSVRFQQWLKWYTDPSQMRIQSYVCPVWPYNHQNFTKTLCKFDKTTSHFPLWLTSLWFLARMRSHPNGKWNGGKFKKMFSRYWFMNLILFIFQKEGEVVIGERC